MCVRNKHFFNEFSASYIVEFNKTLFGLILCRI